MTPPSPPPSAAGTTTRSETPIHHYAIRPFQSGDERALSNICCSTGLSGKDGQGIMNDEIWGDIWVLPYAKKHPDLTWVVERSPGSSLIASSIKTSESSEPNLNSDSDNGGSQTQRQVVGYIVGTDDTLSFNRWFHDEWWSEKSLKYPIPPKPSTGEPSSREYSTLTHTAIVGTEKENLDRDLITTYPAHLHINLLPECRRGGLGRGLMRNLFRKLKESDVRGVHAITAEGNEEAWKFYETIGFRRRNGSTTFVYDLGAGDDGHQWFMDKV